MAFLMTLALCGDMTLHYEIRNLGNDIVFLAFSMFSFHVMELYLDLPSGRKRIILGIILGSLLWYTYSVRLNGIVSAVCVLLAQFIWLMRNRKGFRFTELVPLCTFMLLFAVFNIIIFPQPTSTSSASDVSMASFIEGSKYYFGMLHLWARHFAAIALELPIKLSATVLYSVFDSPGICAVVSRAENFMYAQFFDVLALIFLLLSIVGITAVGIKRDIHIVLFLFASFIGTAALSLGQELRYLYVILPFLLMYAAEGGIWLIVRFSKGDARPAQSHKLIKTALTVLLCVFSIHYCLVR